MNILALLLCAVGLVPCTKETPWLAYVKQLLGTCAPNDGIDDSACIQAELDQECATGDKIMHLDPGEWTFKKPTPVPGSRDNASLWVECGLTIEGSGQGVTTLMMDGDSLATDWSLLRVASKANAPVVGFVLQDLTVAGDKVTNPDEQTHLVHFQSTPQAPGVIQGSIVRRVTLRHPVVPDVSGDCLRFVGEAATPVVDTLVEDVTFEACDRSGIAVQRGVPGLTLHQLIFKNIGKTAIDFEPSGTGQIRDFSGSYLDIQGGGISLGGQSAVDQRAVGLRLTDSKIVGGLGIIYANDVELDRLTIEAARTDDRGALNIQATEDVRVTRSSITRLAASVPGPAVRLIGHNSIFTRTVDLEGNRIVSQTDGDVIVIESAQDILVERNRVTYAGPQVGAYYGVFARATGQDIDAIRVANNRFFGPLAGVSRVSGSPFFVRAVQIMGNIGPGIGLRCEGTAKFAQAVVQGGGYLYTGPATSGCTGIAVVPQWP